MQFVRLLNRYFNDEQPWMLAREPEQKGRLGTVLYNIVEGLRIVSVLLEPAMPGKGKEIRASLGLDDYSLAQAGEWGVSPAGTQMPKEAPILFPKVELEKEKKGKPPKGKKQKKDVKKEAKEETKEEGAQITIDEFGRVELRVAEVLEAEKVPKADKLLKLTLSLGEERRTVVSGIAEFYKPEELPGKKVVLVANLKPAKLRGILSEGMVLAAIAPDGNLTLVEVDQEMPPGSAVE